MAADAPRTVDATLSGADRVFRGVIRGGGVAVLAIMSLVGVFLFYRAWQALDVAGFSFLTTQAWEPDAGNFGIAAVLIGTVLIALVAIVHRRAARARHRAATSPSTRRGGSSARSDQPRRPDGRGAQRRLRPVGLLLPAGPRHRRSRGGSRTYFGWIPLFHVDRRRPERPARRRRPSTPRRPSSPGIVVGADGHADHLLGHARGLLAGAGRRARGRATRSAPPAGA